MTCIKDDLFQCAACIAAGMRLEDCFDEPDEEGEEENSTSQVVINSIGDVFYNLRYKEAFDTAEPMIKELSAKQPGPSGHPVEQLLIALYGWLMLRMKKQVVSAETEAGFVAFRNWANALAKGHIRVYYGG